LATHFAVTTLARVATSYQTSAHERGTAVPGGAARLSTSLLDFGLGGRGLSSRRIRRLLSGGLLGALGRLGRALLLDERGLVKQVRHALRERAAVRAAVHKARLRAPAATRASSARAPVQLHACRPKPFSTASWALTMHMRCPPTKAHRSGEVTACIRTTRPLAPVPQQGRMRVRAAGAARSGGVRARAGPRTGRGCSWPRYWKRGQICRMSASCGRWSSQYAAAAARPGAVSARAREAGRQQRRSRPLVADSSGCCHRCGRTGSQQGGKGARRSRTRTWHAAAAAHRSRSPGSGTAGRRRPQWTARTPRTCGAGTPSAWARPGGRPARSAHAHWLCL